VSLRLDFVELSATDRYKLLGGLVVPRPIALVTSQSPDGRVNAALVVGEVLMAHVRDWILDPATLRVDQDAYAPIGRLFGAGYVRTRDRCEMPRLTYEQWREQARNRGEA
jgi:flavin reductase (DIM6/NTAB) family NADH-FMN oxidoreductase RutF